MSRWLDLPADGLVADDPPWEAWSPAETARRLAGVGARWCVAAGWSLDLHRGSVTREHEDLEIAIPAADFDAIRTALGELEFVVAGDGRLWPLDGPAFETMYQTWGADRATGAFRIDVFREPHEGQTWICRRAPAIRRPYDEIILKTADGIPYLTPEVALLFKAKDSRPKDEADFAGILPLLTPSQRAWLTSALRAMHPDHPWLGAL
jgi:hypothetical protein